MADTKIDNHDLRAKLALRRHFLDKYHRGQDFAVLDCCQGDAAIWSTLRREYPCRYWGVDVKARPGRLKIDSSRILAQPGWTQTVVDIDTYGSPWKHYLAMLPNVVRPLTVFLTSGLIQMAGGSYLPTVSRDILGLGAIAARLPRGIQGAIGRWSMPYMLGCAYRHGLRIVEAREAVSSGHARYFGLRLEPVSET